MKPISGGQLSREAKPRFLSVQDVCVKPASCWRGVVVAARQVSGGAWARLMMWVGCARALSLISVLGPGWLRAGDMMGGGVFPRGYAVRPLGL
jgi:hypothetical protein